eukprot:scaffold206575_cov19-Tisochrysis_lutea.AAC.2
MNVQLTTNVMLASAQAAPASLGRILPCQACILTVGLRRGAEQNTACDGSGDQLCKAARHDGHGEQKICTETGVHNDVWHRVNDFMECDADGKREMDKEVGSYGAHRCRTDAPECSTMIVSACLNISEDCKHSLPVVHMWSIQTQPSKALPPWCAIPAAAV